MRITLIFDSLEGFQDQISKYAAKLGAKPAKSEPVPVKDVAKVIEDWEKKEKAKTVDHAALNESAKKATEIINKAEAKEEAEPEKPATVTEDFRVEVRHVLHELNKQKNSKTAATDIIKTFGVARLTDVPLSDLPALMDKAKEALDA